MNDIYYAQADQGCIKIYTKNHKFSLSSTLSRFKGQINDPYFISIHRSYLVNLRQIDSFDTSNVFVNKTTIPMSKIGQDVLYNMINRIKTK